MAARIYLAYDRLHAEKDAAAVHAALMSAFGPDDVLPRSVTSDAGFAPTREVEQRLANSQVVLVLMSPGWHESIWLQYEVANALRLSRRVIPVILGPLPFPHPSELTESLRPLLDRSAARISAVTFSRDVGELVRELRQILVPAAPPAEADVSASDPLDTPTAPDPSPWTLTRQHLAHRIDRLLRPRAVESTVWTWQGSTAARTALFAAALLAAAGTLLPYLAPADLPGLAARPATTAAGVATTPVPVPPAGTRFRDCPDDTCPWMVVVPPGSFVMGSPEDEEGRDKEQDKDESPQHRVTIRQGLAVMETEVTVAMYRAFVAETGRPPGKSCFTLKADKDEWTNTSGVDWRRPFAAFGVDQADDHPVVCVGWADAQAFARWMTRRTGQPYRLLSESEWEYAARAGSTTRYAFGTRAEQLCDHANVADQRARRDLPIAKDWTIAPCDDGHALTAPVASYRPNAFGLFDMHGNAWEWVQDCYAPYTPAEGDGHAQEATGCDRRLLRGGAWSYSPRGARSAIRSRDDPTGRLNDVGFRLARMLPPGS